MFTDSIRNGFHSKEFRICFYALPDRRAKLFVDDEDLKCAPIEYKMFARLLIWHIYYSQKYWRDREEKLCDKHINLANSMNINYTILLYAHAQVSLRLYKIVCFVLFIIRIERFSSPSAACFFVSQIFLL